eukprot:1881384-Pleurochrysis_carterae.AAC.1
MAKSELSEKISPICIVSGLEGRSHVRRSWWTRARWATRTRRSLYSRVPCEEIACSYADRAVLPPLRMERNAWRFSRKSACCSGRCAFYLAVAAAAAAALIVVAARAVSATTACSLLLPRRLAAMEVVMGAVVLASPLVAAAPSLVSTRFLPSRRNCASFSLAELRDGARCCMLQRRRAAACASARSS